MTINSVNAECEEKGERRNCFESTEENQLSGKSRKSWTAAGSNGMRYDVANTIAV